MNQNIELLSPGGSPEAIRAAVNAGADAVYAGGSRFGARAYADNPDEKGFIDALDYCHLHGVKLYITVNTLLKERELTEQLYEFVAPLYERGVDAVLVQDMGVFRFLKREFPLLPLHASTQMTITGPGGAGLLEEIGAARAVLSRELSLQEISEIHRSCGIELETFVHGALCYCYSGQCLMSSMIGGRSGNRGRCAQPCRLPYRLQENGKDRNGKDRQEKYLLSLKDICTLELLPDLYDCGIRSLKIEGRMKRAEYAAGVTSIYRRYLDLYREKGRSGYRVDPEDLRALMDLYNRGGFSEGYYRTRNGPFMMAVEQPNHCGTKAAGVQAGGRLKAEEDLFRSDRLEYGEKEFTLDRDVPKGEFFRLKGLNHAKDGEAVMRTRAGKLLEDLKESYLDTEPRIPVTGRICLSPDRPLRLTVRTGENADADKAGTDPIQTGTRSAAADCLAGGQTVCAEAQGALVQRALKKPLDADTVERQIRKTGGTPYVFKKLDLEMPEDVFCPVGDLNTLRREALDLLTEKILSSFRRNPAKRPGCSCGDADSGAGQAAASTKQTAAERTFCTSGEALSKAEQPAVSCQVRTYEQLLGCLSSELVKELYLDCAMFFEEQTPSGNEVRKLCRQAGKAVFLMLPPIWRIDTEKTFDRAFPPQTLREYDGIVLRSFDQIKRLKEWNCPQVIADAGLYSWNREAREFLRLSGVTRDTLPYECSLKEWKERGTQGSECVIYGRIPLMITAQCLKKNSSGCTHLSAVTTLTDRRKAAFPVRNECAFCYNTIYNSVPLELISLSQELLKLPLRSLRLSFTTESGPQTEQLLRAAGEILGPFLTDAGEAGEKAAVSGSGAIGHRRLPEQITRGHYRKGVE